MRKRITLKTAINTLDGRAYKSVPAWQLSAHFAAKKVSEAIDPEDAYELIHIPSGYALVKARTIAELNAPALKFEKAARGKLDFTEPDSFDESARERVRKIVYTFRDAKRK